MENSCYVALSVPSGGYANYKGLNFNPSASVPFTIESWVQLDGMGSGISMLKKGGVLDWGIDNGCLYLSIADGMVVLSDQDILVSTIDWHHVAITFDLSFIRFYIDGNFTGCVAAPMLTGESTEDWRIGSNLDGRIRYLRIYDSALDASDIMECMFETPSSGAVLVADVDFSCNPPVDHLNGSSSIGLMQGAEMNAAYPALLLKGTAYALPSNSAELNPGGAQIDPYTIHARVYVNGINPYMAILTNGDNSMDSGIALYLTYSIDDKGYKLCALRGSDSDVKNRVTSVNIVKSGEWVSVACTYDGNDLKLYINGVLDSEVEAGPILMPQETGNVLIGGMLDSGRPTGTNTFQGYISRLEIWNVALDEVTMKAQCNATPEIESSGLVEAFDFTNRPIRSETSCVAVALCDNACFEELLLPAPAGFSEPTPVAVDYGVDMEWVRQMRQKVDFEELARERKRLFASKDNDGTEELEMILGFKLTEKQRQLLAQRRKDNTHRRNALLGVTHHLLNADYVLLAHYGEESQVIYRCHVSEIDDCQLRLIELLFILIGGMVSALFGIKTKLNDKAVRYMTVSIINLASVQVIMAAGNTLKGAQVYQLGKELSGLGVLKELLKMVVVLGFWALLRFLAKVVLTFLGVGWVDTIASLAATAITFGIAYVAYVKYCRPLPQVSLHEIRFNHDLNRSDISALNIRVDHNTPVRRPEWIDGNGAPVAYCKATVNPNLCIKARFRIASVLPYAVSIRAQAAAGNFLGNIPATVVDFLFGESGEVTLNLINHAVAASPMGQNQVQWTWEYLDNNGQWVFMDDTIHTVYLTNAMPGTPWTQAVNNEAQWPWTDIFILSTLWMNGAQNLQGAIAELTGSIYNSGMDYGGFPRYIFVGVDVTTFDVSQFLQEIQNPNNCLVECRDCAFILTLLANIWGNNLIPQRFQNKGEVRTAYIRALGANQGWNTHNFGYHVIACNGPILANNSPVYDSCVAVDSSNNPWNAAGPHIPMVPGTQGNAMLFGPPANVVLPVPYNVLNNYSDRFYENVPASKANPDILNYPPIQII